MIGKRLLIFIFGILLFQVTGCFSTSGEKGVVNKWRDPELPVIVGGVTTQSEILELLGPPSQIIDMGDQNIFYYMLEKSVSKGTFLIIFNWKDAKVTYDRAIFFFNDQGILTDYAFSSEKAEYESEPE